MLSKAARPAIEEPMFHMLHSSRLLTMLTVLATSPIASSAEFKLPPHTFTVPDGFVVSASFDDHGRLYVTDSSDSNAKPDELKNPDQRGARRA